MTIKESERINPIKITDKETNRVYILDFNRDTIQFAEAQGFTWEAMRTMPATMIPLLWYCAFRRYDRKMTKEKAQAILDTLGGMRPEWIDRLSQLYMQGMESLVADTDENEEDAKNAKMTVELD